jgi:NADH-quinone oxidoreductase subunit N
MAYGATGTLGRAAFAGDGAAVSLATALLLAGLAFKFALAPFHMWTPDAFAGAPAAAVAFAATGAKVGVAIILLRIDATGPPDPVWSGGLAVLAGASILAGNLLALRQTSVARMLGYSSVAHAGYAAAVIAAGGAGVPEAVLFYLAAYAPALVAALCVTDRLGEAGDIGALRGLVWQRPLAGAALAVSLVSLAGLPVSVGFFGKFYVLAALIRAEAWPLFAVAVLGAGIGIYVYARFIVAVFRRGDPAAQSATPRTDAAVLILCSAVIAVLGLFPVPLVEALRHALD